MEKEYIQKLLDSYMAAETTKEEERLLSDYFCSHQDIPAEWQNFSVMFRGLRQVKARTIVFHKRLFLKWSAVAAVAASIILAFILWPNSPAVVEQPVVADVVELPAPEAPETSDYSEYSDYSRNSEPPKPAKPANPKSEPVLAQAEQPPAETDAVRLTNTADSLAYYLTRLENQMGDCRDSTCLAHLSELMRADERIKGLVNKIIHKQVETAYQEEYLVDTTTHYIPL